VAHVMPLPHKSLQILVDEQHNTPFVSTSKSAEVQEVIPLVTSKQAKTPKTSKKSATKVAKPTPEPTEPVHGSARSNKAPATKFATSFDTIDEDHEGDVGHVLKNEKLDNEGGSIAKPYKMCVHSRSKLILQNHISGTYKVEDWSMDPDPLFDYLIPACRLHAFDREEEHFLRRKAACEEDNKADIS
jgi:hypothetical protein